MTITLNCAQQPQVIVVKEKDYNAARRQQAAKQTNEQLKQDSTWRELMNRVRNP